MFKCVILFISLTSSLFAGAQALPENSLNGTYDMQLAIGDTVFNDIMVIEGLEVVTGSYFFKPQKFSGSITVPGIFTAPMENANLRCNPWSGGCDMYFEILAKENGKEFKVYYSIYFDFFVTPDVLEGKASLENNVHLGNFIAKKRNANP